MKKTFRRIAAALCALSVFLAAGCGSDTDEINETGKITEKVSDTENGTYSPSDTGEGTANGDIITAEITTELITTPVALEPQDMGVNITDAVPAEYTATLIEFYAMVKAVVDDAVVDNEDGTFSSPYFPNPMISYSLSEAVKAMKNITMDTFGYALRDIDKNGSPELILMCDNNAMLEIYTILGGEVRTATFFWPSFTGVLDGDGNLYTEMLNGTGMRDFYAIETLGSDVGYFNATRRLSRTIVEGNAPVEYFEQKNDDEISVTKAEFEGFVSTFPKIPKFTDAKGATTDTLGFIPINIVK